MKVLTNTLTTIALACSASAMAGSTAEVGTEQAMDTLVKKLTMSCYRNREGDRLFVGAAETVRFCRSAAKQTVVTAFEQKGIELASVSEKQMDQSIN